MGNSYTDSFSQITDGINPFTRRWASNNKGTAVDPLVTGYCFVKFMDLPTRLPDHMLPSSKIRSVGEIGKALASSCTSVTLPGATQNKAEFTGLGGVKFFYPTNKDWDDTVSLRFTEWSGAPIHHIIHAWGKMIADYRTGVNNSTPPARKGNVTGSMYYWTTKADGVSIDFHCFIVGMFPMMDPTDQFGFDITTIDKLELDIDFSCDMVYQEEWTYNKCSELALAYKNGVGTQRFLDGGFARDDSSYA